MSKRWTEGFEDYITAALWSTTDTEGNPLDGWASAGDISHNDLVLAHREYTAFLAQATSFLESVGVDGSEWEPSQLGHDFWLTRNGHGAGFWDGDWNHFGPTVGKKLTELSQRFGTKDLYVGDDEVLYFI